MAKKGPIGKVRIHCMILNLRMDLFRLVTY
jgi:hypothetical protein